MNRGWGVLGVTLVVLLLAAGTAGAHLLDHPVPSFAPQAPLSSTINAGGENADWELVNTIPTGNPHTDLDFFTSGGETYTSVGTLANGPNAGGQTIVKLTNQGVVDPEYVTGHPSASCLSAATGVTGLQHDVEATPKGGALPQSVNRFIDPRQAQLLIDSTDAPGRCHDQGVLGAAQVPQGGIEIIDITNPAEPKEIGLTTHIGQAHTVNVDPKRPHIAFDITQDGVTVGADGKRSNETSGNALDGFEIVDMSSCMNFPSDATLDQKRAACRPQVYRYRYPDPGFAISHTHRNNLQSCHEVEIYDDDKLACSSITATILFDLSGAFDDMGTPTDYTDDKPRGTPLPCRVRDSSTAVTAFKTAAKVTDCVIGTLNGADQSLTVSEWLKIGAPSLQGVQRIGTIHHLGFASAAPEAPNPAFNAKQDVFAAHETELSGSRSFLITSDERGGGVVPGGATCSPGVDNERGNGGLHAYPVSKLRTTPPPNAAEAQKDYALNSQGDRAIYRAQTRTGPQGSFCTSHVFQQIPGQNRIFMGWYSQGTQVVDFEENKDGTIDFREAGWFTPENANTWTSHIFKVQQNQDGTFTYWGATGDFMLAGAGRNAIDIYKVTLPAPPKPRGGPLGEPFPISAVGGLENTGSLPACAAATAFEAADARPRGRGLEFSFSRRGSARVRVELLEQATGRRIRRARRVTDFGRRARPFTWNGRRGLPPGVYIARFSVRAANGRMDVRRVPIRFDGRRFFRATDFERRAPCALIRSFALERPVFGGARNSSLGISFSLGESARVTVEVRRGGKLVRRFRERSYSAGRRHKLRLKLEDAPRGTYSVKLRVVRPGRTSSATLAAARL